MTAANLEALRRDIIFLGKTIQSNSLRSFFHFGEKAVDSVFREGLQRGAIHEVFASQAGDAGAATGFIIALALRAAASHSPIIWVEEDFAERENGVPYAAGLHDFGLAPERLIIVRCSTSQDVLKAACDSLGTAGMGAVIIAPWSNPKCLDLTASRKLLLTAQQADTPAFLLRLGAAPADNAAVTRWMIRAAPSRSSGANAPGHPVFDASLIRNRMGMTGRWLLEWESDDHVFKLGKPVSGPLVSIPSYRSPQERRSATGN